MAITMTCVKKVTPTATGLLAGTYYVTWDSSYAASGEAVPSALLDDFDYIFGASIISNDTLADNGYKFGMIVPAPTVAASTANCLFDCHWEKNPGDAGGADIPFPEFSGNLSSVGQMMVIIWGA